MKEYDQQLTSLAGRRAMLDIPQYIVNEENETRLEKNNAVHLNQYKSSNMYQKCLINLCLFIQCELPSPTLFSCFSNFSLVSMQRRHFGFFLPLKSPLKP